MPHLPRRRPSAALVVASLALFVALDGPATAAHFISGATIKPSSITTKQVRNRTLGVQDLSKSFAAAAQASLDESMSAFKALTGVKSLKDAFELQTSFARAAMEKSLAESGKLTDASFKLTEQAMAPIAARVTVAVEKFAKVA